MTSKSAVRGVLQSLIRRRENELNLIIKRIITDNISEFESNVMREYQGQKGIKHEKTIFYSPRSNGIADKKNRILFDKARILLVDSYDLNFGQKKLQHQNTCTT
ncbi:retrovirus-related Pol polyprotein from transposon TNT 1-94 [Caerostris extrusa]|uniref:Retrovirus-related Pol polyprotein from transposon TNT 1-94 n=1 Tax=Caerostris extrusa TaxID=172846 RepID=A0AAV4SXK8_CAEEX|nr:retrovirus-related Pol polyprotein from transposon TNT 1-94 [Caerostris extrusa]